MRIHYCSKAYHGAVSDKEVVKYDAYASEVANGYYKDKEFYLYDDIGVKRKVKGAYFITDAGYPEDVPVYVRY